MTEKIIIAGSGGQGIMLLGKVLAEAAMREGRHVTWLPAYGAEVRGGTAHCMVIVSDEAIGSPYVVTADTLILMNAPSLEKFKDRLDKKGLLVVNSSLAATNNKSKEDKIEQPFTDIAIKMGNIKIANMIALGCFISRENIVKLTTVSRVISDIAPENKRDLVEINQKALQEGAKLS